MSEEQLKAFIAKVQEDSSLQEQLMAEGADPIAIAKAAGFTIQQQDLDFAASELSDAELEGVAGGLCGDSVAYATPYAATAAAASATVVIVIK